MVEPESQGPSEYDPIRTPAHVETASERMPGHDGMKCAECQAAFSVGTHGFCERCRYRLIRPKGERTGDPLSEDEIRQMKRMWAQFKSADEIARKFRVSITTVRRALKGR